MFALVYIACLTAGPVKMDCEVIRIEKNTRKECLESAIHMSAMTTAWCDTGRKKGFTGWLEATEHEVSTGAKGDKLYLESLKQKSEGL